MARIGLGGGTVASTSTAFSPIHDLREYGTVSGDITSLLQTAVASITATDNGALQVPAGNFQVSADVGFDADNGNGVSLLGAGALNTIFNLQTTTSRIRFGHEVYEGTVAAGSTTTAITAATGTFAANVVGMTFTTYYAAGANKSRVTVASRTDSTHITLSSALAGTPDTGAQWAISGPGRRNTRSGGFTVDGGYAANYGVFVGKGSSRYFDDIRVTRVLLDGFTIDGTQNSLFLALDLANARRDNLVVSRSAKNIELYDPVCTTARRANLHIYENGLSHVIGNKAPDKVRCFGGILEEDDGTAGAYVATVYIEDGDAIGFMDTTVTSGNTDATSAALRVDRTVEQPMHIHIIGGQWKASPCIGFDLGGGTSTRPILLSVAGGSKLQGGAAPFIEPRNDYVTVQMSQADLTGATILYGVHPLGTSTLTEAQCIKQAVTSDRKIVPGGGIAVSGDGSLAGDVTVSATATFQDPSLPTGAKAQTFARSGEMSNLAAALTSGQLYMVKVDLVAGQVITDVTFFAGSTAAVTPTNQWASLWDSSRNLLRVSADATTAAWGSNNSKTFTYASTYTVPTTDVYYLGLVVVAATVPTLRGHGSINGILSVPPRLAGYCDSGLTTPGSAPAVAAAFTDASHLAYGYCS